MKPARIFFIGTLACVVFVAVRLLAHDTPPINTAATTPPVYVPDNSLAHRPLPDGIFVWDGETKTTDATNGQDFARFTFSFTNIAQTVATNLATKVTSLTNVTTITNSNFWAKLWGNKITRVASITTSTNQVVVTNSITPIPVTISEVKPGCSCTTAEVPPVPWTIPGGSNGQFKVSVNLAGKSGTLFKVVRVSTDLGFKILNLQINIQPPPPMSEMTQTQRDAGIATAKVDRQAVFKGDCATCHVKPGEGKYGQELYNAVCTVCHATERRATMVPDLHALKVYTNDDFWRTWIAHGKPGSLMPAFSTAEGGPLSDMQIASLAVYLDHAMPPLVPQPAAQ
jgi:cytochrome c5